MGKMVTFLSILIFADLFFVTTGQMCVAGTCSLSSIIFNAVLNIGTVPIGTFFTQLIGNAVSFLAGGNSATGILSLIASGGVIVGAFFASKSDTVLFIPVTLTLALIAGDFVFIYSYLATFNIVLATFVVAPIVVIYIFTVLEWLRGKD